MDAWTARGYARRDDERLDSHSFFQACSTAQPSVPPKRRSLRLWRIRGESTEGLDIRLDVHLTALPPPRGVNHGEATCKVERKQQLSIILRSNPSPIARSPFVQSSQPTLCHVRPSPEPVWPDLSTVNVALDGALGHDQSFELVLSSVEHKPNAIVAPPALVQNEHGIRGPSTRRPLQSQVSVGAD